MNRSHKHCGASSFRDLKTIVLASLEISWSTVIHPSFLIRGLLGASKLLFVRDQSLLMVGGGAEDIEGGPSIIFQASRGGQVKNEQTRGGATKNVS